MIDSDANSKHLTPAKMVSIIKANHVCYLVIAHFVMACARIPTEALAEAKFEPLLSYCSCGFAMLNLLIEGYEDQLRLMYDCALSVSKPLPGL